MEFVTNEIAIWQFRTIVFMKLNIYFKKLTELMQTYMVLLLAERAAQKGLHHLNQLDHIFWSV